MIYSLKHSPCNINAPDRENRDEERKDLWLLRSDRLTPTMKAYVLSKLCDCLPSYTMLQCSNDDRLAEEQLETKEYKIQGNCWAGMLSVVVSCGAKLRSSYRGLQWTADVEARYKTVSFLTKCGTLLIWKLTVACLIVLFLTFINP